MLDTINQVVRPKLDNATQMGAVTLGVKDLAMMTAYYQQVIGLTRLEERNKTVLLGVAETPLVKLDARPEGKRYPNAAGLYHLALRVPTREDLGLWLKHFIATQNRMIDGAGDHLVSEALYLADPEGNGIEIYRDRPRETWAYDQNSIKMATLAVDLRTLLDDAPNTPFNSMPNGTMMGHVHLQVNDVPQALAFYCDVVGFDLMMAVPTAGFISAGGYHHHLGLNVWHSRHAAPPPAGSLGLISYQIICPTEVARQAILNRLDDGGHQLQQTPAGPVAQDPAGNCFVLVVDRVQEDGQ